jgi:hypothetical protein
MLAARSAPTATWQAPARERGFYTLLEQVKRRYVVAIVVPDAIQAPAQPEFQLFLRFDARWSPVWGGYREPSDAAVYALQLFRPKAFFRRSLTSVRDWPFLDGVALG